jgi:hypothetical protein
MIVKPAFNFLMTEPKKIEVPPIKIEYGLSFARLINSWRKSALNSTCAAPYTTTRLKVKIVSFVTDMEFNMIIFVRSEPISLG